MKASPALSLVLGLLAHLHSCHASTLLTRDLMAPSEDLDNSWEYLGCYLDVGRTIDKTSFTSDNMTNKNCMEFCFDGGYVYAGTEYYEECFCGRKLAAEAREADDADCNTPCTGDEDQPCGGPDRLTLYKTTGPVQNPGVDKWKSQACFTEGTSGRALEHQLDSIPGANMTVTKCISGCNDAEYILAGVEYGGECYCGDRLANGAEPAENDGCDMPCNGNRTELCGGSNRLNLYEFKLVDDTSTTLPAVTETSSTAEATSSEESATVSESTVANTSGPSSTTPLASDRDASSTMPSASATSPAGTEPADCPGQPASVGASTWYGCYTEATNMRALSAKYYGDDEGMTLEDCAVFCAGYTYFGAEYAQECFCGDSFNAGSVKAAASECNMACKGSECQYCGAGNRLSVYTIGDGPIGDPSSSSATDMDPSSTSRVPDEPGPTGLPEGWDAYGCWVDGVDGRILNTQVTPDDPDLTLESCVLACVDLGSTIAGAEYSTQCFCGNEIVNGGIQADSDAECNTPCGGDPAQNCGGPSRMSIFSLGEPRAVADPAPLPSVGDWTYQGCAQDNVNDQRTFFWQVLFPDTMTPSQCVDACGDYGYMAAGLEYGQECYCGDPANVDTAGAEFVDDSECNVVCAGNSSLICGGGGRLSTYFWEGDPFYSWSFPEDGSAAAGSYDFLVGGVCIPLMTQQAITGKVTFVEKWGTGPPNSTGAYELDLTLVDQPGKMWREMHVKTDVFCAAGVTLPDKAGRQLTVGGWSGDSTFGVRLYTPDGTDGVNGTNDWEENVDILSLQDGRWYPSTLNMANGSILVIGGEDGSNGAPVPTLEILPSTGTAPLYMDWLERTDPNNLYPFMAVLPSGGIFASYWNEGRILDEVTFKTIKTLPNMPTAVNDDMGGRTYPLEGTAVLLPQHAPYEDLLEILICGGSTEGVSNALDNCVTVTPDADDPEWVLERMPSKRVISCMAPLPDGTYLIMNGAQHGVAGFGLAEDPNLSALLYDPTKDAGHRITVMANTTVARLYHSESITLLDGRVLVSGSDPQDGRNPQEYRVESFTPPYLLGGQPRPTFELDNKDWTYGEDVGFSLGGAAQNGDIAVSLLGSVSSTHGNSMGARTLFPAVSCDGTSCTVTAPPRAHVAPPGWYQFFVLDGGIPAVGVFVRIGGDPAEVGNWPDGDGFTPPGV